MLGVGAFVFDAPAVPFAEGVVGPVPAELLEDRDAVADVLVRAFRPGDGAELADVDFRAVALLEFSHGREPLPDVVAVPALRRIGPDGPDGTVDALVRELAGLVAVDLVDHVVHPQRREVGERLRRVPRVGFEDDRRVGVDFADRLRGEALERPPVERRAADLDGLVHEVVAVDRVRVPLEARRDAAPRVDEGVGVDLLAEHRRLALRVASARHDVHVDDDLDSVFPRAGDHDLLQAVQLAVEPRAEFVEIPVVADPVPVARHLVAHERDAPRRERLEVLLGRVALRKHHAAAPGGIPIRIADDEVGVDAAERALGRGAAKGGEVEDDASARFLETELELDRVGARVAENRVVAQDRRGEVPDPVPAVGPFLAPRGALRPAHLELEPQVGLRRLGERRTLGLDLHRKALRAREERRGQLRPRHRARGIRAGRDVHDEAVAVERRVLRRQRPEEVRERRQFRFGKLDVLRLRRGGGGRKQAKHRKGFHRVWMDQWTVRARMSSWMAGESVVKKAEKPETRTRSEAWSSGCAFASRSSLRETWLSCRCRPPSRK